MEIKSNAKKGVVNGREKMDPAFLRKGARLKLKRGEQMNIRKNIRTVLLASVLATAFVIAGCKTKEQETSGEHVHKYTCPHHPEVVQSSAGTCPKCGMKLKHMD